MELEIGRLKLQKQKSDKLVQELQFLIKEERRKRKKERKRKVRGGEGKEGGKGGEGRGGERKCQRKLLERN